MAEQTTVEEWQNFLNEQFPDGAVITFVLGTEQAAVYDESPQALAAKITVSEIDNDSAVIVFPDAYTGRQFFRAVDDYEPRPYGYAFFLADGSTLMVSNRLTEEQKALVKQHLEGF
jgi:hypothetical protein